MTFKEWLQIEESKPTKEYTSDKRRRLALARDAKPAGEPKEPDQSDWTPVSRKTTFSIGGLG